MATVNPNSLSESSKRKHKRKRSKYDQQLDRLDSLSWNPSLPDDDSFSLLLGSRELEGGFLSLEEINEDDYGLVIPKPENGKEKKSLKSKKLRKQSESDEGSGDGIEDKDEEKVEEVKNVKDKKKKKKKKKKKAKNEEESTAG